MNDDWQRLLDIRREAAKEKNMDRWTISHQPNLNREYAKNVDKDGLSHERRRQVDAQKERLTYGPDLQKEVWDE